MKFINNPISFVWWFFVLLLDHCWISIFTLLKSVLMDWPQTTRFCCIKADPFKNSPSVKNHQSNSFISWAFHVLQIILWIIFTCLIWLTLFLDTFSRLVPSFIYRRFLCRCHISLSSRDPKWVSKVKVVYFAVFISGV